MDKSEFLFKGQGKLVKWPLSGMQQTVFHLTGEKDEERAWKNKEMKKEGKKEGTVRDHCCLSCWCILEYIRGFCIDVKKALQAKKWNEEESK